MIRDVFNTIINCIKCIRILKRACKEERLLEKLGYSFGRPFKIDWLGRMYMVVNPIVQNLKSNGNTIIYSDNTPLIREYFMRNLDILKMAIGENQLFDILTYEIRKIDDDENYLVILEPIFFKDTVKYFKTFLYIILVLIILLTILIIL